MAARQVNLSPMDWNSFTKPWNDSDVILVVQSWELHVHKSILSLQSPVFISNVQRAVQRGHCRTCCFWRGKLISGFCSFYDFCIPPNMIKDSKTKKHKEATSTMQKGVSTNHPDTLFQKSRPCRKSVEGVFLAIGFIELPAISRCLGFAVGLLPVIAVSTGQVEKPHYRCAFVR